MTKKQILRMVCFLMLAGGIFYVMNGIFVKPASIEINDRYDAFYKREAKNSWDGALIGSSVVDRAWAAPLAWNEYGMALYPMSTDSLPLPFVTNLIEEIHKKQNTNFFVIDLRGLRSSKLELQEFKIRRLTDNMKFSKNRMDVLGKAFTYAEKYNEDKSFLDHKMSFYIPFIKYHPRWEELNKYDFTIPERQVKGVYEKNAFMVNAQKRPKTTDKIGEISELQLEILLEILEYGKENNLQLLFTSMPGSMSQNAQKQMNKVFEIIKEYGFDYINFNKQDLYDELGIDFATDYIDPIHLNSKGARKVTSYLGSYINEHYNFSDKRGEESYKSWDDAWKEYDAFYNSGWQNNGNPQA